MKRYNLIYRAIHHREVRPVPHVFFLKRRPPKQRTSLQATFFFCLLFGFVWCKSSNDLSKVPEIFQIPEGRFRASMCRAHSHNDYHQTDPLNSALQYGLKSVEVDVFPRQNGLWVAHTVFELNPNRTIDNMYIRPILDMLQKRSASSPQRKSLPSHGNRPIAFDGKGMARSTCPRGGSDTTILKMRLTDPDLDNLNFLVDFKGDADQSALLLQSALAPLRSYMSRVDRKGRFHQGKLTVLITGNRPNLESLISVNGDRFLFLDGRLGDVYANADSSLVPLVSIPWRQLRLARALGRAESYMRYVADKAHSQGKIVRIWGVPNRERFWSTMVNGGIDLLSIDDHAKFARFVERTSL